MMARATPGTVLIFLLLNTVAVALRAEVPEPRERFLQAEQALNQGHPAEARGLAGTLAGYPLQPYLLARIIRDDPQGDDEIRAFLDRYGETRDAVPVRKIWLERLVQRRAWADYVRDYRETSDVPAQCDYYWALLQLGRAREAVDGAARLWASGDPRPATCDRLFTAWQATPHFGPDQVWKRFGLALRKKTTDLIARLKAMVPAADRTLADFWSQVDADPGLVRQCGVWGRGRIYGRIFAHGIDRLAARETLLAQSVWNLRRSEFELVSEETERIDRRLAIALATQHAPQAAAYLGAVPDAEVDAEVRTWRVRASLLKQDWPGVLIALDRLAATERGENPWRYWRARALEALGDTDAALGIYRDLASERDFYGLAAADRLQQRYALSFEPLPIAGEELRKLMDTGPFRRLLEFRALNRAGEARSEWVDAIRGLAPRDLVVAAKLAQTWGWDRLAILAMARADGYDDLTLRFPLAYSAPVQQGASERGMDPAVLYGLIRRESAFDAAIRSGAGALGLMQIMPGTGADTARRLGDEWRSERILLDPGANIRYGTAYFRGLLDQFDELLPLAAAAYNAGPGRVRRWLPVGKPLPADIWIETIPFTETRHYVSAVLAYAVIYHARLGGPPVRISAFLPEIAPGNTKPDLPMPVPVCP